MSRYILKDLDVLNLIALMYESILQYHENKGILNKIYRDYKIYKISV